MSGFHVVPYLVNGGRPDPVKVAGFRKASVQKLNEAEYQIKWVARFEEVVDRTCESA